jgi:hypothetical protein
LWTASEKSDIIKKTIDPLLQKDSDAEEKKDINCLFSIYYDQRVRSSKTEGWKLPTNVIPCSDPDVSLNFESAYEEAIKIFQDCNPEAEFMPAAEPDPEDDF